MRTSLLRKLSALDHRIPDWQPFPTEVRSCPFCGERASPLFLRPDNLPVAQCSTCCCFYISLELYEETLMKYYHRYWTDTCPRPLTSEMVRYLQSCAQRNASSDPFFRKIASLSGTWKDRKVLDAGCGFGEKAVMMKALGAFVIGLDISEEAVRFMNEKLGIEAHLSTIESFSGDGDGFDIVTMFEFVEHPLKPLAAIESSIGRLKKGGLLVIVTPNGTAADGWTEDHDGWPGFRADLEHMQYLHVDTVAFLSRKLGCRVVHLEQSGFRPDDVVPTGRKRVHITQKNNLKRIIKGIPGVRKAVYAFRDYQARKLAAITPPRDSGTYHLFAILQKTG